jgi:hypothetical protein
MAVTNNSIFISKLKATRKRSKIVKCSQVISLQRNLVKARGFRSRAGCEKPGVEFVESPVVDVNGAVLNTVW